MTSDQKTMEGEPAVEVENVTFTPSTQDIEDESRFDGIEVSKEAVGGTVQDLPPGYFRSANFIGTVIALCLGQICCYFGFVLPANILSIINEDIGPDPNYVWTAMIWNLTQAVSFVLVGRLSDLFGRRWFFIIGNSIGLVGAIIACTARTVPVLLVGSALLGIAAAVQLSFAIVIGELIPNKYRGFGISFVFVAALPVTCFGPVIVRAMVTQTAAGWRWSFYLDVIINVIVVILFYFFYHPPTYHMLHARRQKEISKWKMVDILGVALFTGGLLIFLLGLSWGGSIYPWKSAKVIGMIIGGAAILIIFALWEIYGAGDYPLVPMRFFKNRAYVGVIITAAVGSMVYYSLLVLSPIQISVLYETTIMVVGWKSCVIGSGALIGQGLCGLLVKGLGRHKLQMVIGVCILTAFTGAMAATSPSTSGMAVAFIFLASMSLGYVENVAFTIGPFCLKQEDLGIALGLLGTTRSPLATSAQAVFVSILTNKLIENVPKYVIPAAVGAGLPESSTGALLQGLAVGNFSTVPGITPSVIAATIDGNKVAYSRSFKFVYLAAVAFGACGIVAALNAPNSESKFTNEIARKLHGKGLGKKEAGLQEKKNAAEGV